jgi:beta-glucosidase
VSFTVTNTGNVSGTEIAELYAGLPGIVGETFKRLVAWQRVTLAPGESKIVKIVIDKRMLSTFDATTETWSLPVGEFPISAGSSSRDLPLQGDLRH